MSERVERLETERAELADRLTEVLARTGTIDTPLTSVPTELTHQLTPLGDEVDRRRFRANVVVETDDGMAFSEAAWPGHRIRFGDDAEIDVVIDTERCAVTTWDPDTIERDTRVLATIARERENFFGVYCRVVRPGWVAVGDPVVLTT